MEKVFAALFLCICGCSSPLSTAVPSPSGEIIGNADVFNDLVRINLTIVKTNQALSYLTHASDFQKWAWAWALNDVFVLYSSDIGTYAYEVKDGVIVKRVPEENEHEVGRNAYAKKYGNRPRH